MTSKSNRYARQVPLGDERHHKTARILFWGCIVFIGTVVGVLSIRGLIAFVVPDGGSGSSPPVLAATEETTTTLATPPIDTSTTVHEPERTTTTAAIQPSSTSSSTTSTTTTSTSTPVTSTTTSTTTTTPPLPELPAVALPPTKAVLVRVSWQAERQRPEADGGGVDYMRGSTAEGIVIVSLPAEAMTVDTNQEEGRYEITVDSPPVVSYALWSLSSCRLGWSGNPAEEVRSECPGFHEVNPDDDSTPGKVRAEWKQGLFYPWFSRSSCIRDAEDNASVHARAAIRRHFAQEYGIDEESVWVSEVPVIENAALPFDIPESIAWPEGQTTSLEGYEFQTLSGGIPCQPWSRDG